MSFWDVVWFIFISFMFVAYLMVLFSILSDLFRDRDTSGLMKAVWIICLIVVPFVTALVYLIARGKGMGERSQQQAETMRAAQDDYIRDVAGSSASPADQIAKAKAMLDTGAISPDEYTRLKGIALA
jgi:Phospholipase_D-nuclease N-terminal